jgi:hypothetical protein
MSDNERRRLRDRASTLFTVDETVERIDVVARDLAVQLERFSTALDHFTVALDRFSAAAERIDHIAERLDPVLTTAGVVTAPVVMAKAMAKKVRRPAPGSVARRGRQAVGLEVPPGRGEHDGHEQGEQQPAGSRQEPAGQLA